jgi:hypothetical protein
MFMEGRYREGDIQLEIMEGFVSVVSGAGIILFE